MPSLNHLHTVFLSDPLPGVGVGGRGEIVVEPEKTLDCEYVSLWYAKVEVSLQEILSSSTFNIDAANAPLPMGQEMF